MMSFQFRLHLIVLLFYALCSWGCSKHQLTETKIMISGNSLLTSGSNMIISGQSEDGDYFSKPSADDIFEEVYEIMHETNPSKYPKL